MVFKISPAEVQKRQKNILLGLLFSVGLALVILMGDENLKAHYNDILLGSIILFFVFANIFNGIRHIQWKQTIQSHHLEAQEEELLFWKEKEKTVLKPAQIQQIRLKRRQETVTCITVRLVTGNKIRLEGYEDMDKLAKWMTDRLKAEQVVVG